MGVQQPTRRPPARIHEDVRVAPPHGYEDRVRAELPLVVDWLHEYVSRPHPGLNRKGPVCPFVPAAMKSSAVRYHFRYEITGQDRAELAGVLLRRLDAFSGAPSGSDRTLDTHLVVLPDLSETGWTALDRAHADLKDAAVERGLMIGQFHPACDERSARNAAFRVSRAPIPLLAIRRMAPHDVLFLHHDPRWFAHYRKRFAADYETGLITDRLMRTLYARAEPRHDPAGNN
ncbi:DUF6875 domain-containing protein [Streptomyces sp. NBC_01190]|uniref:DUF6875 domain-containing protein n=1 Tax=Streptomyces sp. NBC_01190 TaxID=2903767 RepID=UPI00386BA3E3|nr:hypothetical protein OG519_31320 [Streptomyces sp. NBC_01190]